MKPRTLLLLALSLAFCLLGYYFSSREGYLGRYGKKTTAMVFDSKEVNGQFAPVALFTTEDGYIVKHVFSDVKTEPTIPGTEIEILYDPRNPNIAEVNSFYFHLVNPLVLYSVGIILLIVAIISHRSYRSHRN